MNHHPDHIAVTVEDDPQFEVAFVLTMDYPQALAYDPPTEPATPHGVTPGTWSGFLADQRDALTAISQSRTADPEHRIAADVLLDKIAEARHARTTAITTAVALVRADQAEGDADAEGWSTGQLAAIAFDIVNDPRSGWDANESDPDMIDLSAAYGLLAGFHLPANA